MAIFCPGLILGGVISAVMAWILGGLFSAISMQVAVVLVAVAVIGGLLRDWHVVELTLPEPSRQTPRSIFARGMVRASFRFGVELGTGWLTYLTSTLPYVLVSAVVLLHLPFHLAICAGVGFGAGRAAMTLLRLLDPDGEAWDRRMAEAAGWLVRVDDQSPGIKADAPSEKLPADPNESGCSALCTVMRNIRPEQLARPKPVLDYDTFFHTEYQRLFQTMYLLMRDRAQAEDIAQEAMARTYERWRRIRDPAGYAYRTAFNLRRSWLRRLAMAAAKRPEPASARDEVEAAERRVDVLRALAELPRTQREALVLVAWADMTAEEAGRVLSIQPVSIRGRVHRAKATLRQRLGGPDG